MNYTDKEMTPDERLMERFKEGIVCGMAAATICFVFLAFLFPFLFILE